METNLKNEFNKNENVNGSINQKSIKKIKTEVDVKINKFSVFCKVLADFYDWMLGVGKNENKSWVNEKTEVVTLLSELRENFIANPTNHYVFVKTNIFDIHILNFYEKIIKNNHTKLILDPSKEQLLLELLASGYKFDLGNVSKDDKNHILRVCNCLTTILYS